MNETGRGGWVKGQSGNPNGRPPKERERRFYHITLTACTFKDWREIVKKAVAQAKDGDAAARKFLADYIIGPPVQRADVTTAGEPLQFDGAKDALISRLLRGLDRGGTETPPE